MFAWVAVGECAVYVNNGCKGNKGGFWIGVGVYWSEFSVYLIWVSGFRRVGMYIAGDK